MATALCQAGFCWLGTFAGALLGLASVSSPVK